MPTSTEILVQLAETANAFRGVAFAWHVAAVLALAFLSLTAWRPRAPHAAWLSAGPVASAAILAVSSGNPFNAVGLGLIAVVLAAIAGTLPERRLTSAPAGWRAAGLATVAYALAYPHFTAVTWWWDFAFAPTGVLPCPSLALAAGFGLLAEGFGSRAWSWVLATAAALYGVFGVARLGVWLDLGLVAAGVALAARAASLPTPARRAPRPA